MCLFAVLHLDLCTFLRRIDTLGPRQFCPFIGTTCLPNVKLICNKMEHMGKTRSPGRTEAAIKRGRDLPSGKIWRYQTAFCCRPQSIHAPHWSHDAWAFWRPPPAASEDAENALFGFTPGNIKMLMFSRFQTAWCQPLSEKCFAFSCIILVFWKRPGTILHRLARCCRGAGSRLEDILNAKICL